MNAVKVRKMETVSLRIVKTIKQKSVIAQGWKPYDGRANNSDRVKACDVIRVGTR